MTLLSDKIKISEATQRLKEPFTPNTLFKKVSEKGLRSRKLFYIALDSLEKDGAIRIEETERRAFDKNKKVKQIYRMNILSDIEEVKRHMLENTEKLIEKHSRELKKKNDAEKEKILKRIMNKISARFGYRLIELYEFEKGREWIRDELTNQFFLCLEKLYKKGTEKEEVIKRLQSVGYSTG
jgi:DNA-binding PadR family transcriptional regulator